MNKVYKLIWDGVRRMYIAVSEITKSHGKSKSAILKKSAVACLMISLLVGNVYANNKLERFIKVTQGEEKYSGKDKFNKDAKVEGPGNIAIGDAADAEGVNSMAIGNAAEAGGFNTIAIGTGSSASSSGGAINTIAIGMGAKASNFNSIAIGKGTNAIGSSSIALSEDAYALHGIAIGRGAKAEYGVAIGIKSVSSNNSIAINGKASGMNSVSIFGFDVKGDFAISIGLGSHVDGNRSIAIGSASNLHDADVIGIGHGIFISKKQSAMLGNLTESRVVGGVAIGSFSVANRDAVTTDVGKKAAFMGDVKAVRDTFVECFIGKKFIENGYIDHDYINSAVSIGCVDGSEHNFTRQLTGLAAGTEDTDAVNVAQAKALVSGEIDAANTTRSVTGAKIKAELDKKANVDLDNLTDTGANKVKTLAGEQITATVTQDFVTEKVKKGTLTSDTLNVTGNGKVVDSDLKIDLKDGSVTKGKLANDLKTEIEGKANTSDLNKYVKNTDLSSYAKNTELAKKANVDLDNLTTAGTNKVKTLAGEQITATVTQDFVTEKVKKGTLTSDTLNVTGNGKVVDSDLKIDLKDGSVTKGKLANDLKTEIEGKANTSDLNNYVKNTDLSSYAKSTELAKKANVDLDNLTTAGTNKVKTLAGEQITATVTQDFVTEKVKKGALTSDTLDVTGTGKLVDSDLKIDLKDGSITKGKLSNDLKTEIEGKANASDLNKYVKNTDLSSYAKTSDLNAYAKNTELATKADKNAENIEVLAWQKKLGLADNSATVTPGSTTTTNLFTTVNQLKAGYTVKAGTNTFDMKLGDTAAPTIEFAGDSTNGLDVAADKAGKKITYAINKDKLVKSIAGDLIKQMNGEGTPGSGDHGTPGSGNPSGHGTGEQGQTTPLPVLTNVSTGFNIAVGNDSKNFTFGKGKETNKLTFAGTNDETSVSISGEDGTPTITVGLADTFKTKVNNKADKSELSSYAKNSALKELETKVNNITGGTTNIEGSNIDLSTNNTFKTLQTSVEGKANADGSNVTTPSTWATKLGTGEVATGNANLVTGGKVFDAIKDKADKSDLSSYAKTSELSDYAKNTELATKANADLDNLTATGTNKVKTLAGEQIAATVTEDFVTGKVKKGSVSSTTLDVTGDGKMVGSDLKIDLKDGIVTKKKLSNELKTEIENKANASDLTAYAKTDATNITGDSLTKWQSVLGNGTIAENNKGLVTGGTVHTALKGKANVDLDNLTTAGTNKVKTLAGEQIAATVTEDFVTEKVKKGNVSSTTLDVTGDGKMVGSDLKIDLKDGIVTKKKLSSDLKTEIEGKANASDLNAYAKTDATNITGESLTKWQSALGNGTIAENNKGLVTGGTVHTALKGKADKNAKNIEVLAWKKKLGLVDAQATQDSTNDIFTQVTNINNDITNLKGGFIVSAGTKSKEITLGGTTKDKLTFASADKNLTATFNETTKTISYGVNVANLIGDINKSDTKITNVDLTNNQTITNLKTEIQNITGGSGTTGSLSTKANTNATNLTKPEDILAWQKKLGLADNSATVQPGSTATTNLFTTVNQLKAGYTVKAGTNTFDMKLGDTTAPTIEFAGDSTNGLDVAADKAGKKITYAINKEKLAKYIAGDLIKQMNGEGTPGSGDHGTPGSGNPSGHGTGEQGQTTPLPVLTNVSTGFNIAVGSDSKNFTFGKGKETNKLTFAGINDETVISLTGEDGTPTVTVGLADTFKTKVNNKADKDELKKLETKVNNITGGTTNIEGSNIDLSTNNTFKELKTSVEGKANADGSNVTTPATWAEKLGTGEVATGNANLVTGGKVFDAIKDKADKSALSDYAKNSAVTELETKVKNITNGTTKIDVKNIDLATNNTFKELKTSVEGKANADGSNVTTPATWAEKLGTGEVATGNANLVTGGKVFDAIKDKADKSDLSLYAKTSDLSSYAKSTELAKKANVDLDNLTDTGTSKVKSLAREQITATVTQDFVTGKVKKGSVSSTTLDVKGTGKLVDSDLIIDLKDGSVTKGKLANDLKTEIEGKANTSDLNKYVKNTDLSSYAKTSDLNAYAKNTELATKADKNAENIEVLAWQKKLGLADNSATVQPGSTATTNLFTTVNQLKAGYTVKAGTNTFDMKLGDTTAPTIEFAGDSTNGLDVAADKEGKKITYAINKDKLVKYIAGDLIKQMNGEGTPGSGDHGTPGSGNPSGHGTGEQGQTTPLPVLTNVSTGFNIAVGNDSKNFTFGKGKETNKLTFAGTNDETSVSISGEDGTPTITVGLADTFKTKVENKADKSELTKLETKVTNITNGTTKIDLTNIDLSTNNKFKELKTSVEGKANADGSNVTTPATWAEKLGTGEVATGNANLVTGGKVFDAIKDKADKSDLNAYAKNTELAKKADKDAKNIEVLAWKKKLGLVDAQATQDSTTNISTQVTNISNDITNLKGGFIVSDGTKSKEITLGGTTKDKLTFASADKNLTATFNETTKTISYGVNVANLIGDINKSSTKITNVDLTNNQTITNLKTEIQNITNNGTTSMNGINFYLGGTSSGTTYTPSAKAEDKWQSSRIVFGEGLKVEKLKDAGSIEYTRISATGGGQSGKSAYEIWRDHKDDKGITPNSNKSETEFLDSLKGQSGIKGADGKDGKSAYEVWRDYKEGNDSQPNKGKSEKDFMNYMKGKDCSADIQHIADNVTKGLSAMDGRMNSISAGAAALSALHPVSNEYNPDDKLDFSVGFGHYRGENAVAIGAYYRPNPNMMVSLGGAFNGYDNLLNAGLSWKLGKGNEVAMLSKKVLLNEVIRLTKINKEMAAKIELQEEKIAHQESMISEQDARLKKIEALLAVK